MSFLQQRERAEEALFARKYEISFEMHARRNRLFGLWAAQMRRLDAKAAQSYATELSLEDFPHYRANAVLRRVARDLAQSGRIFSDEELSTALAESADRAQEDIWNGASHLCC